MILGYQSVAVDAPGYHWVSCAYKDELLAAMHELKPRKGARLVLFGTDVAGLREPERRRLMRRVGYVPADGGLMSPLNAWENISLPLGYHAPQKLRGAAAEVQRLLDELGGVDDDVLAKLPEQMTLY
jgi:ABC-type transporter Mla maintaining outer membrane lipid asymmetry ATPase subunit MlaF